jgi:hypothetical protein
VASRVVKARAASQINGKHGLCAAPPTSVGGFFARSVTWTSERTNND